MKFRKKPVVIDATNFQPEMNTWPEGVYEAADGYYIDTLEGRHTVTPGDWIVTGVRGERYPVKPDIFVETYEPVRVTDAKD
jgi:hypothetical protein